MKTMKTQRAVLPLAFLSAAFMLGCQDQGSEPVGPEGLGILLDKEEISHTHGGGGDGGSTLAAMDLTVGMLAELVDLNVKRDTDDKLKIGSSGERILTIEMNFTEADRDTCVPFAQLNQSVEPTPEQVTALVAELTAEVENASLLMLINKNSLGSSGGHRLLVQFDGTLGDTSINLDGSVKVTRDDDVFTFTGPVTVGARGVGGGGGAKSARDIVCPGTGDDPNKVVVTVTR